MSPYALTAEPVGMCSCHACTCSGCPDCAETYDDENEDT